MKFFILGLILQSCSVHATESTVLPHYEIDLSFLEHPSVISRPSPAETDAYIRDVSRPESHPVFSGEALLFFGGHRARVFLIASRHDGETDVRFIEQSLARFAPSPHATLFVEQGDPFHEQGGVTRLRQLTTVRAPALLPLLDEAAKKKTSLLNPSFGPSRPFLVVAREWVRQGRHAVNFDAAANFSDEAVASLAASLGPEMSFRFLREELHGESMGFADFRNLVASVYSRNFQRALVDKWGDCCANLRAWAKEIAADFPLRDRARERYMKSLLAREIQDGDIILTHPVHMDHILHGESAR